MPFPDRHYEGFIDEVSPEANRQKATVQVKVKIVKPDDYLRPEMNASVAFISDAKSGKRRVDEAIDRDSGLGGARTARCL